MRESIGLPEPARFPSAAELRFEHGVNGRYLADVLGAFEGAVRYSWSDPASPIVITSADAPSQADASHLCVLMPMRV